MTAFTIDLSPITGLNPPQFEALCAANPDIKLERTPTGEWVIMSLTGGETGRSNAELTDAGAATQIPAHLPR